MVVVETYKGRRLADRDEPQRLVIKKRSTAIARCVGRNARSVLVGCRRGAESEPGAGRCACRRNGGRTWPPRWRRRRGQVMNKYADGSIVFDFSSEYN